MPHPHAHGGCHDHGTLSSVLISGGEIGKRLARRFPILLLKTARSRARCFPRAYRAHLRGHGSLSLGPTLSVVQALPLRGNELLSAANLYTDPPVVSSRPFREGGGACNRRLLRATCTMPPSPEARGRSTGGVCELDYVAGPPSAWCSWSTNRRRRRRRRPREQLNLCRKHRECVLTTLGTISRHEGGRGKSVPGHRPSRPDTYMFKKHPEVMASAAARAPFRRERATTQ